MDSLDAELPTLDAALLSRCLTMLEGDVAALCASACVSKAWNLAAQDTRVWRWLVVPRRLADELTDERFKELLGRSGGAVERLDISHCGQLSDAAIADAIQNARASLTHLVVAYTCITAIQVFLALGAPEDKRLTYLSLRGIQLYNVSDLYIVRDDTAEEVWNAILPQLKLCVKGAEADAERDAGRAGGTQPRFYTVRKDEWEWDFKGPHPPKVVLHCAKDPRDYDDEHNPPLPKQDEPPQQTGLDVTSACAALLLQDGDLAYGNDVWADEGKSWDDAEGVCGNLCGGAAARAYGEVHCPQCQHWICSICAPKLIECDVHDLVVCNTCMHVQDGYWCSDECFNEC